MRVRRVGLTLNATDQTSINVDRQLVDKSLYESLYES